MAKNETLARKPGNTMKKNVGETSPRDKMNVTGSDNGLASSGMLGKGVNRAANPHAGDRRSTRLNSSH